MTPAWNRLQAGDCIKLMSSLPAESAALVFADPPFNIGYEYDEYEDRRDRSEYRSWTVKWVAAALRLLKPDGSFFVAIGDDHAADVKSLLDVFGLTMRNWIIWHYTFGVSCTKKFARSHTHILYYVANPKRFTFNDDSIRVPSDRQTKYADKRANPKGKIPDDVWKFSRVCGTFKERTGHPCQMPESILERIIKVASNPGDVVIDPFGGSFTTAAAAKKLNRKFWSCDLSKAYVKDGKKRIEAI